MFGSTISDFFQNVFRISFREILLGKNVFREEGKGNCLKALRTASEAFCKVEMVERANFLEVVRGRNLLVTEVSFTLRSISRRNRTVVVQHWRRGNDWKPLEEQELISSRR